MNIAVIFPGQGSQFVGMGKDFYQRYPLFKNIFERGNEIVSNNFVDVVFNGPEEILRKTDYTQPSIFLISIGIFEIIKDSLIDKVKYFAGHSLGEYSALFSAGGFTIDTGLELVKKRGLFMQGASATVKSSMAAVIGLSEEKVKELCERVEGYITIANINSLSQIVISGEEEAIDKAENIAKELGAKRYVKLNVSGAFHSKLMEPAMKKFKKEINNYEINDIKIPVISNVTAKEVLKSDEIKDLLVRQIISPVRWVDSILYMKEKGVDTFIEVGPGNVLIGLIKKIDRNLKTYNINKVEDIEKIKSL